MKILRRMRRATLSIATLLLLSFGPAFAADPWPTHAITLVVPFPPGGPTDLVARVIAERLTSQLGQTVIVDNRPGANANIGNGIVAKAAPDGYTILYNTSSLVLSPALYRTLPYDVQKDFAPVILTAVVPLALVVNNDVPAKTVQEFIAYAKANPGKLSYGSGGNGNVTHLGVFQFVRANGIEATHVPYKGSAPMDVDLAGGQVQFATDTINSVDAFVKGNRMRLLAVTTAKRVSLWPDVPTLAESGMPGFDVGAWQGICAPAGTPTAVIDRLNAEVTKALHDPELLKRFALQGAEPLGSTPEAYRDYIKSELVRWAGVVKASGVTLD